MYTQELMITTYMYNKLITHAMMSSKKLSIICYIVRYSHNSTVSDNMTLLE